MNKFQVPKIKFQIGTWYLALVTLLMPVVASAASPTLTFRHNHYLIFLEPYEYADWYSSTEEWTYRGDPIKPLAEFLVDGDTIPALPEGVVRHSVPGWDKDVIRRTLQDKVSSVIDREPGSVVIKKSSTGGIVFEGVGLTGRRVRLDEAVEVTIAALGQNVSDIVLPVDEIQPEMTIDSSLKKIGIKEVVTVGESDYSGSPLARKHNINVGLNKFNGALVEQGAEFSFNEILGPVNRSTGYKPELVILGDKTLPEYGGGLCQVSTTAYRGVWEYGFPISKRRNHSFAVSYYSPQGTDATIYPPHYDMKFINDSPGALLIQTYTDGNKAYYIYYGTKDNRASEIIGPFTWDHRSPPPDRTEYTTEIPAGTTRKAGGRVRGLKAAWFRVVKKDEEEEIVEPVYSVYEARPEYIQIGIVDAPDERPSWLGG
ncbi:MAG: VanW family protein [Kiritimatiellales bacterium]|nr:VanW family protein [Kiritimatiellales bacterium]